MSENKISYENLLVMYQKYERLLYKYSYVYGHFDMDLYSECKIALFVCLRNFRFNEKYFKDQYKEYFLLHKKVNS